MDGWMEHKRLLSMSFINIRNSIGLSIKYLWLVVTSGAPSISVLSRRFQLYLNVVVPIYGSISYPSVSCRIHLWPMNP